MNAAEIGRPAPDAAFPNTDGSMLHLSDFWRAQPTVFIFLRHFG
jgi:peroxiredoxin